MLHTNAMMACKTFNAESDQHHLGEIRHDGTVRGRVVITMPCHAMPSAVVGNACDNLFISFGFWTKCDSRC